MNSLLFKQKYKYRIQKRPYKYKKMIRFKPFIYHGHTHPHFLYITNYIQEDPENYNEEGKQIKYDFNKPIDQSAFDPKLFIAQLLSKEKQKNEEEQKEREIKEVLTADSVAPTTTYNEEETKEEDEDWNQEEYHRRTQKKRSTTRKTSSQRIYR